VSYLKHYLKLMRKAEQRGWTKKSAPCYVEEHHVFPIALFGKNTRTVLLTSREHYIAHLLLYKGTLVRYGKHPFTYKMARAVTAMCITNDLQTRNYSPSRVVASARQLAGESQRGVSKPESAKLKMSIAHTGKKRGPHSPETRRKISIANTGYTHTRETKEKMSAQRKGREVKPDHREKLSRANMGMKRWNNGIVRTWSVECPGEGWVPGWSLGE
jgi:hypothetical protein